jgi:hypothetical protein
MAYELLLPPELGQRIWKAKIRDRERVEPPHVTVLRGTRAWRLDLKTGEWMDSIPDPLEVPRTLRDFLWSQRDLLRSAWDRMYPENPVSSTEETSDD